MRAPLALLVVITATAVAGCYSPLDQLPEDTVAVADIFEEVDFGYAELRLQTASCIALSPAARFTLNGQEATYSEPGGRGRDPISAFVPECLPPYATWSPFEPSEDGAFEFVVEDQGISRRAVFDADREVVSCDFPACEPFSPRVEIP